MYIRTYIYIYMYIMCIYIYTYICIHMHICICVYINIDMYELVSFPDRCTQCGGHDEHCRQKLW